MTSLIPDLDFSEPQPEPKPLIETKPEQNWANFTAPAKAELVKKEEVPIPPPVLIQNPDPFAQISVPV